MGIETSSAMGARALLFVGALAVLGASCGPRRSTPEPPEPHDARPVAVTTDCADPISFCGQDHPLEATSVTCQDPTVEDLSPLACLAQLENLAIVGGLETSRVADLTPLVGLRALRHLTLADTSVVDLSPLAGLVGLRTLQLHGTQVADLRPLSGLVHLEVLMLARTPVSDLGPLTTLRALQRLELGSTKVVDLGPLASLAQLRQLKLERSAVADLAPLSGLRRLESLWIFDTQVASLAPLFGLPRLEKLMLRGAPVPDAELAALQQRLPSLEIVR